MSRFRQNRMLFLAAAGVLGLGVALAATTLLVTSPTEEFQEPTGYQPRRPIDSSGYLAVFENIPHWGPNATFEEYATAYRDAVPRGLAAVDKDLREGILPVEQVLLRKANLLNARGDPLAAYQVLKELEARIKGTDLEEKWLYTIIYYQGVTALRIGENDNCIHCRGESACIFPIDPAAIHTNPAGSRLAIEHFNEYLRQFPNDLEVKWLLTLAHMTLGDYPGKLDPNCVLNLESFGKSELDIGCFRDVSHRVGLERWNQSGGGIMEDFDNDGLLDLVVTSWAPDEAMAFYRNRGDGTFEDRTKAAGLDGQKGGLYCVQADYNNDGHMDIFVPRGSWMPPHLAQRPSLLRSNGNGTFTDVTAEAGLAAPVDSTSAAWADYDNDGFVDLFVCCRRQPSLLYRNLGNGKFEQVADRAGLGNLIGVLGAAWIDYDNDGYPDLFVNIDGNIAGGKARLFHNNRNGTFTEVTEEMGIHGPIDGFSCWAFDCDNDGWLDIFASTRSRTLKDVVKGLIGQPHDKPQAKLYRNLQGKGFQDVTVEFGLDKCYSPMGSNFGDLTNDGYLDFYLGTGAPGLEMLVPNRLFKNVGGKRFTEITASSRTGHLQKGHSVAIGDWDRNGTQDIFIQLGGAIPGDRYHNVLFQNPGQGNNWLNVKLVGAKTNRAAIGARIKVVTAGDQPLTVHRHVTSGSSFGANPLEQHIGLGKATRVALLEVYWPASGTTQVFKDIGINQGVVITEFAADYRTRSWKPITLPRDSQ